MDGIINGCIWFLQCTWPLLGGYLVDHLDWHWLFWIFLPIGIIAFGMIMALFPKVEGNGKQSIDYIGSLFMTVAIVPLLLAFSWAGTEYAWGSVQILGLIAASIVFAIVFVLVEKKAKNPILPLHLFKNNIVTVSNIIGFIMNFGMMGAMIYLSFFVQGVLGISPTYAGYVTMPMSIVMVISSTIIGQLISKTGKYKRFALIGVPTMIAGMAIMIFMNSVPMAILSIIVFGLGLGIGMPVFSIATQNAVSHKELGVVTASTQLFRNLGGTIGIAVMGTVMANNLKTNLQDTMQNSPVVKDLATLDPKVTEQMVGFANPQALMNKPLLEQTEANLPADVQPIFAQMIQGIRDALGDTLSTVFLTGTIVLVVAFLLVFFLKEIPLRTSNQAAPEEKKEEDIVLNRQKS